MFYARLFNLLSVLLCFIMYSEFTVTEANNASMPKQLRPSVDRKSRQLNGPFMESDPAMDFEPEIGSDPYVVLLNINPTESLPEAAETVAEKFGFQIEKMLEFGSIRAILVTNVNHNRVETYLKDDRIAAIEPNIEMKLSQFLKSHDNQMKRLNKFVEYPGSWTEYKARSIADLSQCNEVKLPSDRFWALNRISHRGAIENQGNMTYYYNENRDGSNIVVYMVDSGLEAMHPEFAERASWAFSASDDVKAVPETTTPWPYYIDMKPDSEYIPGAHGTHVAGLIGGKTTGVAKDAQLIGINVVNDEGKASLFMVLQGLQHVYSDTAYRKNEGSNKFMVVLLSLVGDRYSKILSSAVYQVARIGVLFVAAAGNSKKDACFTTSNLDAAITVGATNAWDYQAAFSNYGSCVDIFAPGDDIFSSFGKKGFATTSGTSMAAALVAGALAKELEDIAAAGGSAQAAVDRVMSGATQGVIKMQKLARNTNTPNWLLFTSCDADGTEAGNLIYARSMFTKSRNGSTRVSLHPILLLITVLIAKTCLLKN